MAHDFPYSGNNLEIRIKNIFMLTKLILKYPVKGKLARISRIIFRKKNAVTFIIIYDGAEA